MKNKVAKLALGSAVILTTLFACKKSFLEATPQGVLDENTLANAKGLNKLLLAAYAILDGHDDALGLGGSWGASGSNFNYGSVGGGEAHKGSDPGDQYPNIGTVQRHEVESTNDATNDRWKTLYEGIKRTNIVIQILGKASGVSDADAKNISGQARFLRAWYHFQLRITFEKVPYIDDATDAALAAGSIESVANDTEIWPNIVADAKYAYENLPEGQDAIGRANKWVAGALYGKILMFSKDFATAKTVLTDVVNNGKNSLGVKFDLNTNFDDNFNVDFDNSKESVFAFQSSANDGSNGRNGNWGDALNRPGNGVGGCCGFFNPTFYLTNSYKTDASGLPDTNPQTTTTMSTWDLAGLTQYAGNVDTRLDWTVGRIGVPYHDWGTVSNAWTRDPSAGPFQPKKNVIRQSQLGKAYESSFWSAAGVTSLNINLIRFSDVILLLAEAEIEAGSLATAFSLINRVRSRAKDSRTVSFPASLGTPKTEPYATVFASKAEATTALRLERKLELAMEGHRFFDLVRWGIAAQEIGSYYDYESSLPFPNIVKVPNKPTYTSGADDYYAIPQQQIDLSKGFIKQR
ncbi:MAG: hypothetical protein RL172_1678 [Bacteroidota bacterium]|jgi:starch-binding outer membrane protein, SusD/RagB family